MKDYRFGKSIIGDIVFDWETGFAYKKDYPKAHIPDKLYYPADYIIYKENNKYYAKNGRTGEVEKQDTDAATVIQYALDHLTSGRTWKEKVILKGDFDIGDNTILIPSYTIFELQGRIHATGKILEANTVEQIEIRGGKYSNEGGVGIEIISVDGFRIEGVEMYDVSDDVIRVLDSKHGLITGNYIHDTHHDGIEISKGCEDINIENNLVINPGDDGIDIVVVNEEYTYHVNIIGNIVINAPGNGIKNYGGRHVNIIGNIVINPSSYGISVAFFEYPDGTYNKPKYVTVVGNIVSGAGKCGIDLALVDPCEEIDAVVSNNYIENSTEYGIWLYHVSKVAVVGNTVKGNGYSGIGANTASELTIEGNIVELNNKHGIYLKNCNYNIIANNRINKNARDTSANYWGIVLETPTSGYGIYNIIKGNIITDPDGLMYKCAGDTGYADNNVFIDNIVKDCKTPPCISTVGVDDVIKGNKGYVTENSGVATFSGDGSTTEFKIEHGLVKAPSKYGVSPLTPDADAARTITVDDTYIIITFSSAPPSGTDNLKFGWWVKV